MSVADSPALDRAIAETLADAVLTALVPGASAQAWAAARDASHLLSLDGLERALAVCEPHAGSPLPREILPLADRLIRLAGRCRESGNVAAFRGSDRELHALAEEIGGFEWSLPGEGGVPGRTAVATLGVAEALEDLTIAGDDSHAVARRSRLSIPVAAALRAALDWLMPDHLAAPGVRLHGEPSLLQVRLERVRHDRLSAAHRVLAAVGGNLGPLPDAEGGGSPWIVRVPSFALRPTYLLLVQAGVPIALPWHAVLKLRIVPGGEGAVGRALDHPYVEGPAGAGTEALEHPVVLLGHGLKRGYLAVERLIWRMAADPCEHPVEGPAGLTEAVRTEEGEGYWLADPERLLAGVEVPTYVPPPPVEVPTPTLTHTEVTPLHAPPARPAAPEGPPLPLSAPPAHAQPALAPREMEPPAIVPSPGPAASPVAESRTHALLAEDSITARVFLTRLLEQRGFTVTAVASSAELMRRLGERPWAIVFTDVELPDAYGQDWLRQVRHASETMQGGMRLVALVRDRSDLDTARAGGIPETLLKPFARDALSALLARLGFVQSRP